MSNITKNLINLANSSRTVFTTTDLGLLWEIENKNVLRVTIYRLQARGYLKSIRKGIYKLSQKEINPFELAGKLKKNSYLSFETVLMQAGVINQWHDELISASTRNMKVKNSCGVFIYRQLPEKILANRLGIIKKDNYFIAAPERALCDKIYKDGLIYFDDLKPINQELILEISRIYNKRLVKDIKKIFNK